MDGKRRNVTTKLNDLCSCKAKRRAKAVVEGVAVDPVDYRASAAVSVKNECLL